MAYNILLLTSNNSEQNTNVPKHSTGRTSKPFPIYIPFPQPIYKGSVLILLFHYILTYAFSSSSCKNIILRDKCRQSLPVGSFDLRSSELQWTTCSPEATCVCYLKENTSSTLFNTLNENVTLIVVHLIKMCGPRLVANLTSGESFTVRHHAKRPGGERRELLDKIVFMQFHIHTIICGCDTQCK